MLNANGKRVCEYLDISARKKRKLNTDLDNDIYAQSWYNTRMMDDDDDDDNNDSADSTDSADDDDDDDNNDSADSTDSADDDDDDNNDNADGTDSADDDDADSADNADGTDDTDDNTDSNTVAPHPTDNISIDTMDIDSEFIDIIRDFRADPWFISLSDADKLRYIKEIRKLRECDIPVPSVGDIINMHLPTDIKKMLIQNRRRLDKFDKMAPNYEYECRKFVQKIKQLQDTSFTTALAIREFEHNFLVQNKATLSLKERILTSKLTDKTKYILYDRYMTMIASGSDDAAKYTTWIETALHLPTEPKKIKLNTDIQHNLAVSQLMTSLINRLNEKIYDMEEAKEELLCMVSNMIINPNCKNKVIGLLGPPGIGKTKIVQVISEIIDIPMEQISLGGITDSSVLEGHGFTYKGSEPGYIVKTLIKLGCTNGIIFFDELDKISKTDKGKEIEHALLHITDFTQNHDFKDRYLAEISINLSDCIFIYSMNSDQGLDSALASRIPIIRFNGYTPIQKIDIVEKYILPEILDNYALSEKDVIVPRTVVKYMIEHVVEEGDANGKSGIRGLKNFLNRLIGRVNFYRLAAIDGKVSARLSFHIPHFAMPYTLSVELVLQLMQREQSVHPKHFGMYL